MSDPSEASKSSAPSADAPAAKASVPPPPPAPEGIKASPSKAPPPPDPELDPLGAAKAEVERLKDAWMRTAADFDNFRKRSRRELDDAKKGGREELLKEMLPVFDNLARGAQSAQKATEVKAVVDGFNMILKQFEQTLARLGITKVPTTGNPFDPQMHEAIQQIETTDHPPGTVVAEVQPGYMNGERLVRAAMVVVAKPKAEDSPS